MSTLTTRLFGRLRVQKGEQMLDGLHPGKMQELFAYLMLHRIRPHSREALASLLWNNGTTTQSLKYLRQTLWQLQTALVSVDGADANSLLLIDSECVGLNPNADLWLDVAVFEQAFSRVQGVPGRTMDMHSAQMLQDAVKLYQGDLLEGWYQDWCLYERERLQNLFLTMLVKLMSFCEAQQKYELGLAYGTRILKYDPAHERTHRRLMRLQYLAGNRSAALRQYERCAASLDKELGVKPAKRTEVLCEQIRTDQLDSPSPVFTEIDPVPKTTTSLPTVLDHLKQLRVALADIQCQVEQNIQAVERSLNDQP